MSESDLIADWIPPEDLGIDYEIDHPENALCDLSSLNVFIGANNSGKSRLIRSLFNEHHARVSPRFGSFESARQNHKLLCRLLSDGESTLEVKKIINLLGEEIKFLYAPFIALATNSAPQILPSCTSAKNKLGKVINFVNGGGVATLPHERRAKILQTMRELSHHLNQAANEAWNVPYKRVYVPPIRGLRPLNSESTDFYKDRTLADHFGNKLRASNSEVVTGLGLYEHVRKLRLGPRADRKLLEEFEVFLANRFFEGEPFELIPTIKENVLHMKIGREVERPIYALGDGLQQVLILTYPLFLYQSENLLLFIEEPELHLHAGLQRQLINTFIDPPLRKEGGCTQVFVSTHSPQFLDLTLDHSQISVFRVSKRIEDTDEEECPARCTVASVSNADLITLRELGIHNSAVLLVNATIWVEGITDRMYMRRYLQVYQDSLPDTATRFVEDIHYSFVEYSGSNLSHWDFLDDSESAMTAERLCGSVFLIADRDKGKEAKHKKIKSKLKKRYQPLPCLEIENLLSPAVLTSVVSDYERSKAPMEGLEWDKYKDEALGKFIDSTLGKSRKRKAKYADPSGTLRGKLRFAEKAVNVIQSVDDLSPAARSLVKEMHNFIADQNPRVYTA